MDMFFLLFHVGHVTLDQTCKLFKTLKSPTLHISMLDIPSQGTVTEVYGAIAIHNAIATIKIDSSNNITLAYALLINSKMVNQIYMLMVQYCS